MKIGIMSFHRCHNYGAVLQAYALQEGIKSLYPDCSVEYIDLDDELINVCGKQSGSMMNKPYCDQNIKLKIQHRLHLEDLNQRKNAFEEFVDHYISCSEKYKCISSLYETEMNYDVLIAGSDQIWNTSMTIVRNCYFLDFNSNAKKVSYGSSLGQQMYFNYNQIHLLRYFDHVSLRESNRKHYLEKMLNHEIDVVLDPTLLLTKEEWNKRFHLNRKRLIKEKYIFCYLFHHEKEYKEGLLKAEELAKKENKRVILVNNYIPINKKNISTFSKIGPMDWCNLIYHADYVITNSFHGMAFSINFEKQFIVLGRDPRKMELLSQLDIKTTSADEEVIYPLKNIQCAINKSYDCLRKILE